MRTFKIFQDLESIYSLAENLSKTVHELLTGEVAPLSIDEFMHWVALYKIRRERQEKESKNKGKSSGGEKGPRPTLGG